MEGGKDKSGYPVAIRMKHGISKVYYLKHCSFVVCVRILAGKTSLQRFRICALLLFFSRRLNLIKYSADLNRYSLYICGKIPR